MEYNRSPFREKQSNYSISVTPKRTAYRNEQASYNNKQNPNRSQISLNRKDESMFRNNFLETTPKHITSEMIADYENDFSEKAEKAYKRQGGYEGENGSHNKSFYDDNKKLNAKQFEIESKLNKIQSFHQKIQTLLDRVTIKPKTPSKNSDLSNPLTPKKSTFQPPTSRSISKVSPLNLKQKFGVAERTGFQGISREMNERRQARQQKYGDHSEQNYYNKNDSDKFELLTSNEADQYNWNDNVRATSKFNDGKIVSRNEGQFRRESKYFAKENKGPLIRATEEFKESTRKKSKEYMKSIEGEVRDIQSTIQMLNKKIKQVDTISSFKKQVVFDNLLASNPESLSDNQERVSSEIQRTYKPSRTPTRGSKQTDAKESPDKYLKYREGEQSNERSFRKTSTNVMITPSKKRLDIQSYRREESDYKREGIKMSNAYDGDVEPSDDSNRSALMRDIRLKRN